MIQKQFITYNLKIKVNIPYPILSIEARIYPIKIMAMFRYLMYKKNFYNMNPRGFPKSLLTLVKVPICTSSVGGIRLPSLGSTTGE